SDKELTEKLLLFPGAGIKVVNCISLFAYHRTAAAPVDVWIGRIILNGSKNALWKRREMDM
ncbi:MAG: hypothetical protein HXL71_05775, partial [Dialister invisus]|nr:hypothetical protein [Dialister invisus]